MNHLDEGQIQAFLDDQQAGHERAAIAEHLMACGECRTVHEELRRANALIATSLPVLDGPMPIVARRPVDHVARRAPVATAMIRAAGLVLFLAAAAAAAVPGSPVRGWIVQIADRADLLDVPAAEPSTAVGADRSEPARPAVVGTVRGSRDQPLAFARVSVVGDTITGWTDEDGIYRLEGGSQRPWQVRVTHPDHEPAERRVRLPASGQMALDFSLEPLPGPTRDPLGDFRPFAVSYTLPSLMNTAQVTAAIEARYPLDLVESRAGGEAVLKLWLDEYGRVARSAVATSSGHPRLDTIALTTARDMRFRPAMSGDVGVRVIVHMPVVFRAELLDAGN
jgi:TonB family protein